MIRTIQIVRSTRMPAARAAAGLPPIAYRPRPWRYQPRAAMPTANRMPQIQTEAG